MNIRELKTAMWEIIRAEGIEVTNQNIDWLLERSVKGIAPTPSMQDEEVGDTPDGRSSHSSGLGNLLWDYCDKCGDRIEVGDNCYTIGASSYCTKCVKKRNIIREWARRGDPKESEDTE